MKNDCCLIYEVSIWMQPTPMSCHKYTSIQLLNNPKDLQLEKSNIMKRNPTSEKDGICSNFYYFSIISNFLHIGLRLHKSILGRFHFPTLIFWTWGLLMPSEIQDIFWAPHIYRGGLCWFCVFPRIFQGPVGRLRISCYLTHSPTGVMGPHSNSVCALVQKLNILC